MAAKGVEDHVTNPTPTGLLRDCALIGYGRSQRIRLGEQPTMNKGPLARLSLAALCPAVGGPVRAADLATQKADIARSLDAQYARIDALYKDIHTHPELSFQETRTAAQRAAELRARGFEVTEGVGRTGIVGLYRNGAGPTVMVRTELDALPLAENTGLPYASKMKQMLRGAETPGMHACGPDIHMAAWIAVAVILLDMKYKWSGTLMFVG